MSSTVKEIKEKTGYLKRSDLYTIGVGQAIGSGVLTLIGPAILLTGQSAWLAYVAACIWGFMMIAPIPWITSTLKLGGGFYSLVGDMAGKRVAGMYAVGFLPQTINLATYGVAIGMYANSLWPQINAKWFGIAALSVFFAINLCGVDVMAKVQKILVILLFVALGLFIVLGCLQLKNPVFEFTAPDFFSNGPSGFFSAIMLYVYSTNGYSCIMNYGKQAKEAHKDIPKALLYLYSDTDGCIWRCCNCSKWCASSGSGSRTAAYPGCKKYFKSGTFHSIYDWWSGTCTVFIH